MPTKLAALYSNLKAKKINTVSRVKFWRESAPPMSPNDSTTNSPVDVDHATTPNADSVESNFTFTTYNLPGASTASSNDSLLANLDPLSKESINLILSTPFGKLPSRFSKSINVPTISISVVEVEEEQFADDSVPVESLPDEEEPSLPLEVKRSTNYQDLSSVIGEVAGLERSSTLYSQGSTVSDDESVSDDDEDVVIIRRRSTVSPSAFVTPAPAPKLLSSKYSSPSIAGSIFGGECSSSISACASGVFSTSSIGSTESLLTRLSGSTAITSTGDISDLAKSSRLSVPSIIITPPEGDADGLPAAPLKSLLKRSISSLNLFDFDHDYYGETEPNGRIARERAQHSSKKATHADPASPAARQNFYNVHGQPALTDAEIVALVLTRSPPAAQDEPQGRAFERGRSKRRKAAALKNQFLTVLHPNRKQKVQSVKA